jgi:hypothetical protein
MSLGTGAPQPDVATLPSYSLTGTARIAATAFLEGRSTWTDHDNQTVHIPLKTFLPGKFVYKKITPSLGETYTDLMHDIMEIFKMQQLPT